MTFRIPDQFTRIAGMPQSYERSQTPPCPYTATLSITFPGKLHIIFKQSQSYWMTPQLTPWTLGGKTCCRWKFITLALKGGGYIKQQTTKSSFCSRLKNSMNKIAIYQEIGIYKMCAKRIILVRPWRKPWGLKVLVWEKSWPTPHDQLHPTVQPWPGGGRKRTQCQHSPGLAVSRADGQQLSTDLWGF